MAEENTNKPTPEETEELKSDIKIEDIGTCKKKVTVEIPEQKVKEAADQEYDSLRTQAQVPGFRVGRAPRRLLEKRFGKETTQQIKLKLISEALQQTMEREDVDPLREPDIDHESIELPESGPLKFEFEMEVRPDFELPDLKGIPVNASEEEVTDEQVEQELQQLRKYSGVWAPREEGAEIQESDQIIADVKLDVHGKETEEKTEESGEAEEEHEEVEKYDNQQIYVRDNGFVAGVPVENLKELLVGAKARETKQTTVEVPPTFHNEEFRGRTVDITIEIKDVKYLKPAEMDENFLSRFGVEDEDELRENIADSLEGRLEQQKRSRMSEQIQDYLLENTDFELPEDIITEQAGTIFQRQCFNLMRQGLSREELEEKTEQLKASSEEQAKEQLRKFFIMDKVADQLDIEVAEEELNGYIAQMAMQQNQRPEKMREQLAQQGRLDQLRMEIRDEKAVSQLLEWAEVTETDTEEKPEENSEETTNESTEESENSDEA